MDPVTAALMAGALAGASGTASEMVQDAYQSLKAAVKKKFAGDAEAESVLTLYEAKPERYEAPLVEVVEATGASTDERLIQLAQVLLTAVAQSTPKGSKYVVHAEGAKGTVAGDRNIVNQTFN